MENKIPEKFQNEDGTLNAESLLKSYGELEKKIGTMISVPSDDADDEARNKFLRSIGVPDSPDEYPLNPLFDDAPELRQKFREIGLTKKQAESVMELAKDFLSPAIGEISGRNSLRELSEFFGGDEKMRRIMPDLDAFAEKNLSPEIYESLASSPDGIKALYNMMKSGEPEIQAAGANDSALTDSDLRRMMRDPKYWKERDKEYIQRVESGFRKLYK